MNRKGITVFLTIAVFLAFSANTLCAQESNDLTFNDLMQIDEPKQEPVQEKEVEPVPDDNQAEDTKDVQENSVLIPVVAPSFGYPEKLALDLGVEMFWEISDSIFSGVYTLLEFSETSDNFFFRLAAGSTTTYIGFGRHSLRLGGGLGIMPENGKVLLTAFAEATLRLVIFDFKFIYEVPLGPEELKNYYNDNYSPFKFRIGLSNLLLFL